MSGEVCTAILMVGLTVYVIINAIREMRRESSNE